MAVIDPPCLLFSLNHFTFQDPTDIETHIHTYLHCRNAFTHAHSCTERFNMAKWALGRRIQLASLSPFLSLGLSASQGVTGHARP